MIVCPLLMSFSYLNYNCLHKMMATPRCTWKQQGVNTKKDNNGKSADSDSIFRPSDIH